MKMTLLLIGHALLASVCSAQPTTTQPLSVSGIYPSLAVYNGAGEVGIGAVVPWADRLWFLTYPPHELKGSPDKLYSLDPAMNLEISAQSVGGTHAARMIHRESNQLIIGPYFIDSTGRVRAADVKSKLPGRLTAVARHLTDPANKVYFYTMEGALFEVDVHTLESKQLFRRVAPGAHGKGAYTAQRRLVISNNGDKGPSANIKPAIDEPAPPDASGALAEWDGKTWRIVDRKQFTDVTGPGGIYGAPDDAAPLWAIGWDHCSVILKLLDGGNWYTFRLPKATHSYDPAHGWYTEWPRIRQVAPDMWMMDMHGMFYRFPASFALGRTGGIAPMASHLRYIPDFCDWNGRLVLAADDTSIMQNPMAGQSQSNLWFGKVSDLSSFGPRSGWGGVWDRTPVKANEPSDPYLVGGFHRRIIHLAHDSPETVFFTIEADFTGSGKWQPYKTITVGPQGYQWDIFPDDFNAVWIRVTSNRACTATAYLHYTDGRDTSLDDPKLFAGLARVDDDSTPLVAAIIRPGDQNRNLQVLASDISPTGKSGGQVYYEVDESLNFTRPAVDRSDAVLKVASLKQEYDVDAASVIMTQDGHRYRLPKSDARYDAPFGDLTPRAIRECESERYMVNAHGTFYEMPRDKGLPLIKPIATHNRKIIDFCTWRGLMVISGISTGAVADGHVFRDQASGVGLWFGKVDDLWQLGKPTGHGGPWLQTAVKAGEKSDPYLMTGYDEKDIELSHDASSEVTFTLEVDVDHAQWLQYKQITVPAGAKVTHLFPPGFSAHWIRLSADKDCRASAILNYR